MTDAADDDDSSSDYELGGPQRKRPCKELPSQATSAAGDLLSTFIAQLPEATRQSFVGVVAKLMSLGGEGGQPGTLRVTWETAATDECGAIVLRYATVSNCAARDGRLTLVVPRVCNADMRDAVLSQAKTGGYDKVAHVVDAMTAASAQDATKIAQVVTAMAACAPGAGTQCPICQDTEKQMRVVMWCGHSVCSRCLDGLKDSTGYRGPIRCPLCRQDQDIHMLGSVAYSDPAIYTCDKCEEAVRTKHGFFQLPSCDGSSTGGLRRCLPCVRLSEMPATAGFFRRETKASAQPLRFKLRLRGLRRGHPAGHLPLGHDLDLTVDITLQLTLVDVVSAASLGQSPSTATLKVVSPVGGRARVSMATDCGSWSGTIVIKYGGGETTPFRLKYEKRQEDCLHAFGCTCDGPITAAHQYWLDSGHEQYCPPCEQYGEFLKGSDFGVVGPFDMSITTNIAPQYATQLRFGDIEPWQPTPNRALTVIDGALANWRLSLNCTYKLRSTQTVAIGLRD